MAALKLHSAREAKEDELKCSHTPAYLLARAPSDCLLLTLLRMLCSTFPRVWKVGTSLLGLLTPSGPPPQGHGTGSHEPYKTLDFKLAYPEEAMMTAAAQLEWLTVEWLEERRVKVTIRETALTFSVL